MGTDPLLRQILYGDGAGGGDGGFIKRTLYGDGFFIETEAGLRRILY